MYFSPLSKPLCLAFFALLPLAVSAQFKGSLNASTGIGDIEPLDTKINLEIKAGRLSLKPSASFGVLTNSASGNHEELDFRYAASGFDYHSVSDTRTHGFDGSMGVSGTLDINNRSKFNFLINGSTRQLEGDGSRQENDYRSHLEISKRDRSSLNGQLEFRRQLSDSKGSFGVKATYSRLSNTDHEFLSSEHGAGLYSFKYRALENEGTTTNASVLADWRCSRMGQVFGLGAHYDIRLIDSQTSQAFVRRSGPDSVVIVVDQSTMNERLNYDFSHRMQTLGTYAECNLKLQHLILNAKLEYAYTRMEGKELHDLLPTVQLMWMFEGTNNLSLSYSQRLVRPELSVLNPAKIQGAFTLDYGNPDLVGIHIHNTQLRHTLVLPIMKLSTTLTNIHVNDGFNAIWMVKDQMRVSTWGNEGKRRAWSLTPDLELQLLPAITTLKARATLIWDKRIADAISMYKEHWGISAHLGLKQILPQAFILQLSGDYAEGNTVDLYSHSGRSFSYRAELRRSFLRSKKLNATMAYSNTEYARTILTQGAYTGSILSRPEHRYLLSLGVDWSF